MNPPTAMAEDPVCGMTVDEKKAKSESLRSDYQGKTYYFCSRQCKEHFDSAPEDYLAETEISAGRHHAPGHEEHRHD